tara:strand:+ start:723 stop:1514 length:792 start_codon:yes stop_codon:yes gene_type:complete
MEQLYVDPAGTTNQHEPPSPRLALFDPHAQTFASPTKQWKELKSALDDDTVATTTASVAAVLANPQSQMVGEPSLLWIGHSLDALGGVEGSAANASLRVSECAAVTDGAAPNGVHVTTAPAGSMKPHEEPLSLAVSFTLQPQTGRCCAPSVHAIPPSPVVPTKLAPIHSSVVPPFVYEGTSVIALGEALGATTPSMSGEPWAPITFTALPSPLHFSVCPAPRRKKQSPALPLSAALYCREHSTIAPSVQLNDPFVTEEEEGSH